MGITAGVAGASGAAGGELLRLISAHPLLELGPIAAGAQAGTPVTDLHPELTHLADRVFEPTDADRLGAADVVFLALPLGESARIAASLPPSVTVIDLGNDFRLADAATWEEFYERPHAGSWCYGLPELPGRRAEIAAADRVAVPGCYATAAILALVPLLAAGLAEPSDVVITAASGTSSAGRTGAPNASRAGAPAGRGGAPNAARAGAPRRLRGSELLGALRAYQVGGEHGAIPEIEQELAAVAGGASGVSFTPMLANMPRGILASCSIRLIDTADRIGRTGVAGAADSARLRDALAAAYQDEPFVRLLPEGRWPIPEAVAGSNNVLMQAAVDSRAGRAVVLVALDNLGKGGAGQAVQNANLMLGLPETAGLDNVRSRHVPATVAGADGAAASDLRRRKDRHRDRA